MPLDQDAKNRRRAASVRFFLEGPPESWEEVAADVPGHDAGEFQPLALAPREEVPDRLVVGSPRMTIPHLAVEEIGPRLGGRTPGPNDQGG